MLTLRQVTEAEMTEFRDIEGEGRVIFTKRRRRSIQTELVSHHHGSGSQKVKFKAGPSYKGPETPSQTT